VGVEGDAIDDRRDETWVGEHRPPLGERQVGGDRDGGSFFSFGDDLEQQLCSAWVDLDVAEFVEAEQVEPPVAADHAGQLPFVGGFDELVHELCGGDVADPAALLAGREAEADQQMGLAGAAVAEQHHGFAGVQVVPGGQVAEGGGLDHRDGVDVEVREPFEARELGVVDAAGAASFAAVVDFGGEHFGQEGQMGLPFPGRDLGQPGGFAADGR
jgi:hypothetical protein